MLKEQVNDTPSTLSQGAFRFFSGTLLSRITGLGREMAMAFWFGTNPSIAAFFIAFRWASFFRRIFGEASLLSGFIPYFEEKRKQDPHAAALFLRDTGAFLIGFFFSFSRWAFSFCRNAQHSSLFM